MMLPPSAQEELKERGGGGEGSVPKLYLGMWCAEVKYYGLM